MNIGQLDRQVTLHAPAPVAQDGYGAPAPAGYLDRGTAWAQLKPGTGGEQQQADQLTAQATVTWVLRYLPALDTTWRLEYEGILYDITAVAEIGRRVGLTLTTVRRG